jgi:DNA-binding NarL/FixJ family response regulator
MVVGRTGRFSIVPEVIVAADARWVLDDVGAVLSGPDDVVHEVSAGAMVLPAVIEYEPDLVILDLQIGNMGAMAACMDLRLEESGDRIDHVPVLFLLDRRADVFLARRAEAEGWVVKPLDPVRLRKAIRALIDGGTYEDPSYRPPTVPGLAGAGAVPA